jgi:hypothetical protein
MADSVPKFHFFPLPILGYNLGSGMMSLELIFIPCYVRGTRKISGETVELKSVLWMKILSVVDVSKNITVANQMSCLGSPHESTSQHPSPLDKGLKNTIHRVTGTFQWLNSQVRLLRYSMTAAQGGRPRVAVLEVSLKLSLISVISPHSIQPINIQERTAIDESNRRESSLCRYSPSAWISSRRETLGTS